MNNEKTVYFEYMSGVTVEAKCYYEPYATATRDEPEEGEFHIISIKSYIDAAPDYAETEEEAAEFEEMIIDEYSDKIFGLCSADEEW